MRYWVNEMCVVRVRDSKTLLELKDFIRFPNGTWGSRTPSLMDDRVMALVWALIILENEICQRFYEILQYDDNQRPMVLKDLDFGFRTLASPVGFYINEKDSLAHAPLHTLFSDPQSIHDPHEDPEIEELQEAGWSFLK